MLSWSKTALAAAVLVIALGPSLACTPTNRSPGTRPSLGGDDGNTNGGDGGDGAQKGEGEGEGEDAGEGEGEDGSEGEGEDGSEGEGEPVDLDAGHPDVVVDTGPDPCEEEGQVRCLDVCIPVLDDPQNCGDCGITCDTGTDKCAYGECVYKCEPDEIICNGVCVDIKSNSHHCGGCFNHCRVDQDCDNEECVLTCPFGWERCRGECVNVMRDKRHCAECGSSCDEWLVCRQGICECDDPSLIQCNELCRDLSEDHQNCGDCGSPCPDDQICVDSECTCELEGHLVCDGRCLNTLEDESHCGDCDTECDDDIECLGGWCGAVQEEIEPNNDSDHCNPVVAEDWSVDGVVNPRGEYDWFCFQAEANQQVTFAISARGQGSQLDSMLYLHSLNPERELARNDDFNGLDSQITHRFQQAGRHAIVVGAFANGGCPGCTYTLNIN